MEGESETGAGTASGALRVKAGYGIDGLRSTIALFVLGASCVLLGFVGAYYLAPTSKTQAAFSLSSGSVVGFLILVVGVTQLWAGGRGKVLEMEKILGDIPWGGAEQVLDLGCARGLGMVIASKRLEAGFSVGIDAWRRKGGSKNGPEAIFANASREGVLERVAAVQGSLWSLPVADGSIDIVVSAGTMHRLVKRREEREDVFGEIARVLKPGGRVAIFDSGYGPEYGGLLRSNGMTDVHLKRLRFTTFPPYHVVIGRKPYLAKRPGPAPRGPGKVI